MKVFEAVKIKKGMSVVLFLVFLGPACSDLALDPGQQQTYEYWAFDNNGNLGAKGDLTLDLREVPNLSGSWKIVADVSDQEMGPQHGSGRLVGNLDGETFSGNLHPEYVDNNIILSGNLKGEVIIGNWSWITFAGITEHGIFIAIKE